MGFTSKPIQKIEVFILTDLPQVSCNLDIPQEEIARKPLPRSARMARATPSAAALPDLWNAEMDRFICHCEALGNVDITRIIRGLKRKYPVQLQLEVLEEETIEKRIACLEFQENDYFKEGMREAIARVEAAGFVLPQVINDDHTVKDGIIGLVAHPSRKEG